MNTQIKIKTYENALDTFKKNHQTNGDREYAVEVDEQGFVHQYKRGQAHSVVIGGTNKTYTIIHNHPSGGNLSGQDLLSTALDRNSKGVVAVGNTTGLQKNKGATFSFKKGTHFKAIQFANALGNAKLKGFDYTHAVNRWLTANQKKYGYKYTAEDYVNPTKYFKDKYK